MIEADARRRLWALGAVGLLLLLPRLGDPQAPGSAPHPNCPQRVVVTASGIACGASSDPRPPAPPLEALWMGRPLDLNCAPAHALTIVPGIGDRLAARIVNGRGRSGYPTVRSAVRVKGIGPRLVERLSDYAEVREGVSPSSSGSLSPCR